MSLMLVISTPVKVSERLLDVDNLFSLLLGFNNVTFLDYRQELLHVPTVKNGGGPVLLPVALMDFTNWIE